MVDQNDFRGQRVARAELGRRGVDIARADLMVMHGICYIRGEVGRLPGAQYDDLQRELGLCQRVLRQRPEIRDVILDVKYPAAEVARELEVKDYQRAA